MSAWVDVKNYLNCGMSAIYIIIVKEEDIIYIHADTTEALINSISL